jgi:hypothetical protein
MAQDKKILQDAEETKPAAFAASKIGKSVNDVNHLRHHVMLSVVK